MVEEEEDTGKEGKRIGGLLMSYVTLVKVGETELAEGVEEEILKEIRFVEHNDWIFRQWCGDFPVVDFRSIVFCCAAYQDGKGKSCPYRSMILKKAGLDEAAYLEIKKRIGEGIKGGINKGGN